LRKIRVSRNPEQVLITEDNQYAFVRCWLGNTIEIIKIPELKMIKSIIVPSPYYFIFSHDRKRLFIASITDEMFPPNPPEDDCQLFGIYGSGKSILTTVNLASQEISNIDSIAISFLKKILIPSNDSLIYLIGNDVVEYNVLNKQISRRWILTQNIFRAEIDEKNERIFITTVSSQSDSLSVIDLKSNEIIKVPYYDHEDEYIQGFIGIDTQYNRVFIQGKCNSSEEILVFDAITLDQLSPIKDATISDGNFVICADLNSIYLTAGYPDYNMIELDYLTLERKHELPSPSTFLCKTVIYNDVIKRLYTFQKGAQEDELAIINPAAKLDLIEYDISTNQLSKFETTDFDYGCSYQRSLALTSDGKYIITTNSPENAISILELSPASIITFNKMPFISIYPNPTSSSSNISINGAFTSDYTLRICNIFGQKLKEIIYSETTRNLSVDFSDYPNGQYLIYFISKHESFIYKVFKL
jgi:hypothetical protein